MFDSIHEECGVFGIYSEETADVASAAYYALFALQHRGQESCGIAVNDDGVINCYKDAGLVNDVFSRENLLRSVWGKWLSVTSATAPREAARERTRSHGSKPHKGEHGSRAQRQSYKRRRASQRT